MTAQIYRPTLTHEQLQALLGAAKTVRDFRSGLGLPDDANLSSARLVLDLVDEE